MTGHCKRLDLEAALTELFTAPRPEEEFAASLDRRLRRRARELAADWPQPRPRPWRRALLSFPTVHRKAITVLIAFTIAAFVILSAVGIIGPGKVWASLQQILGFVPGVGLVDLQETRLLSQPMAQTQGGITLVVDEAVAERDRTRLHYHIEGLPADSTWRIESEQVGAEEIWLTTGDGQRYRVDSVALSENTGYLAFPPLPEEITTVWLEVGRLPFARPGSLPEDWRIPLLLEPGTVRVAAGRLTTMVYTDASVTKGGLRISVPAVALGQDVTAVTIAIEALNPGWSVFALEERDPTTGEDRIYLTDDQDRRYEQNYLPAGAMEPKIVSPAERHGQLTETLTFPVLAPGARQVTVHLPAAAAVVPVGTDFVVDVGESPEVGDAFPLDIPLEVAGFEVRFVRADIQRDREGCIVLRLTSAPVTARGDEQLSLLDVSAPGTCCWLETGLQSETQRLTISFPLTDADGNLRTGHQTVIVNDGTIIVSGPFEVTWRIPSAR